MPQRIPLNADVGGRSCDAAECLRAVRPGIGCVHGSTEVLRLVSCSIHEEDGGTVGRNRVKHDQARYHGGGLLLFLMWISQCVVVIDEQQKLGTAQRDALSGCGDIMAEAIWLPVMAQGMM